MRDIVVVFGLASAITEEFTATSFRVSLPECSSPTMFDSIISTNCVKTKSYGSGEYCSVTCSKKVELKCQCLATKFGMSFLKPEGCKWLQSAPCEVVVTMATVTATLESVIPDKP